MNILRGKEFLPFIRPCGRTLFREEEQTFYFNWTAAGFEVKFTGRTLMGVFASMPGCENDMNPVTGQPVPRETRPRAAVLVDGNETPAHVLFLHSDEQTELLFRSEATETHTIRIAKLTENGKGFLGLKALVADGELLPAESLPGRKHITFIGDSITCGFGNDVNDKNRLFFSEDENGWMAHGPQTARRLGMDCSVVSSSGIAVTLFPGWFHAYGMDDLYPYTDRILEDKLGLAEYTPWDFSSEHSDYIVLNLGTNDANAIQMMGEEAGMAMHHEKYIAFLKTLRSFHPRAEIICALGTMDYYLYPEIAAAVEDYRSESGDNMVHCFRYPKMFFLDPVGACGHPHIVTDTKMAEAMAAYITALEEKE